MAELSLYSRECYNMPLQNAFYYYYAAEIIKNTAINAEEYNPLA